MIELTETERAITGFPEPVYKLVPVVSSIGSEGRTGPSVSVMPGYSMTMERTGARWIVTSGTGQTRFERALAALGAKPRVRAAGEVLVEISAELPRDYEQAVWELLIEGVPPAALTRRMVERRRDGGSARQPN